MWLYKVIAFIGGFGFSSPKSGLKPRKGRGYAWNNWGNFRAATDMWRPETVPKNCRHKYVAAGLIGLTSFYRIIKSLNTPLTSTLALYHMLFGNQ